MSSYVEVWSRGGRELRMLDAERVTLGTLETNDLVVDGDGVSRVHAVLERLGDKDRRDRAAAAAHRARA